MITPLAGFRTRLFHTTTRPTTIIVGLNGLTRLLATELEAAGHGVSLIEIENEALEDGNRGDEVLLAGAGAKSARCLMASTPNNERNLCLGRVALRTFQVPMVISRLGLPGGVTSWARLNDSGIVKMTWNDVVPAILDDVIPGSALARVARATEREQVTEVELLTPLFLGLTIRQLKLEGCEVLAIRRNNFLMADTEFAELCRGDVLTLVGTKEAIKKMFQSFTTL